MTQGLFGSVTPSWTGLSQAPVWPAFGTSFTGVEGTPGPVGAYGLAAGLGQLGPGPSLAQLGPVGPSVGQFGPVVPSLGQLGPVGPSYANAGSPLTMSGNIATPFVVPGGVPASTVIATMAMRRGQPQGPASDQDVEELLLDAIELIPSAGEVEVRCESGRVSLTGSVPNKRVKRDVGELAWAIPGINDVHNTLNIQNRRRSRGFTREPEAQPSGPSRKQA
jgi:hypothetical protein